MMFIQFKTLTLQCRRSKEIIDLSYQISFFHGKIGAGKSSIARLIDFCLGANLDPTTAIKQELLIVSLELVINDNIVLLEREVSSGEVNATWIDLSKNSASIIAPISPGTKPIYGETIYSLSDLIFFLLGLKVLKIQSSSNPENAQLVRLSLRNFLWYCYLDQTHLDSSFYKLDDIAKLKNSREVMRFVMQYSTQKIQELEELLIRKRDERIIKLTTAQNLRAFLTKFGYSTIEDIDKVIQSTQKKLDVVIEKKQTMEGSYQLDTHASAKTRDQLRELDKEIVTLQNAINDISSAIEDQESLRSELISSKFKLAKAHSASNVLSGVKFENCPCCGTVVNKRIVKENQCILCYSELNNNNPESTDNTEIIRLDLNARLVDIEGSISIHKRAFQKQKRQLDFKINKKASLDQRLSEELKDYESAFLSNIREVDRQVATYKERLKGQIKLKEMPVEILKLEKEADSITGEEARIKRDLQTEYNKMTDAESNVKDLEDVFLNTLITVGLPGIKITDEIHINRKTWEVYVYPNGIESLKWNFYNAGSGGKKTLFNVCYMLSLHVVASNNNLPLPSFMIIDTPMKNIDKEVNIDLFKRFYDHLYSIATGELKLTQIIIIDNSFIAPKAELDLSFNHRYMTEDDDENPPLISYYRGA